GGGPGGGAMKHQHGFSLLEVIAAMLLLAIAFAALMKVAGGAIALSRNAAAHDEAALWARSLLDSAFVTEPVAPGSRSGRFNDRYRWMLDVTPWQVPGTPPGGAGGRCAMNTHRGCPICARFEAVSDTCRYPTPFTYLRDAIAPSPPTVCPLG